MFNRRVGLVSSFMLIDGLGRIAVSFACLLSPYDCARLLPFFGGLFTSVLESNYLLIGFNLCSVIFYAPVIRLDDSNKFG